MKSIEEIKAIRDKMQAQIHDRDANGVKDTRVVVGMATCGIAAGARPVFNALVEEVQKAGLSNVQVTRSGCLGMCKLEPIVEIYVPGQPKITYIFVDEDKARKIVGQHLVAGNVCTEYLISSKD